MCAHSSAPDDTAALEVLDQPGGPHDSALDALSFKEFDPMVVMVTLAAQPPSPRMSAAS
ncbi:hypothetical protein [Streptomyces sp. GB4-14]|uniref:hypothetical protein n=1 Tax=Streptomyces sp. GB4-14 TaxID=2498703 RepID=UPI001F5F249C